MQIYNEKIYDLLQDKKRKNPLIIRETSAKDNFGSNVYVRGLSVYRIDSKADAFRLIKKAIRNQVVRSTDLNSVSSRSHTVLQLFVMTEDSDADGLKIVRRSTLSLIDLAGSEKWRPSLSTSGNVDTDAQVKEMTNINTSLHNLGNCIAGLIETDRKHIPYRDSVLTRLLQSTLSGNGKSIIVATIHSDPEFVDETYSTLQFATRASKVKVTLAQNVGISEKMSLVEAQKHIRMLKKQLEGLRTGNGTMTDLSKSLTFPSSDDTGCEQCSNLQLELTTLRQRAQALEEENQFLKLRCEELTLNSSAFYSNQSSVESSPAVKSTKKKKTEKNSNSSSGLASSKDKGVVTLTSPMLLAASSFTAEPLKSIPEHRTYDGYDHHSDHSDLTEVSTAMLTSTLDKALQNKQQQQRQQTSGSNHQSYDSDSSSISALHSILQAKSPADIAAAALRAVNDFDRSVASNSVSESILGIQAPSVSANLNTGLVTPTVTNSTHPGKVSIDPTASATFTPASTSGLPPPSPAIMNSLSRAQVSNQQGHASVTSTTANGSSGAKVDTTNNTARYSNQSLLATILGTPITSPITIHNQGGLCPKHNLEDCILCAMFTVGASSTAAPASVTNKFSTPSHLETSAIAAPNSAMTSSVTSSITSILKAANASTSHLASSRLVDSTPKQKQSDEFGVTTLRRSKQDDDPNSGKCKHGLMNCLLCNGVPPFDYGAGAPSSASNLYSSSTAPSRLNTLPPMTITTHSSNNHVEMISTLDSPQSKSSFPMSSSTRGSTQQEQFHWQSSLASGDYGNNNYSMRHSESESRDIRSSSFGNGMGSDTSLPSSNKSKRVQEIQAITQLRQSHHLEQQQQQQQQQQLLQQKLHPRSSSSPLPTVTMDGESLIPSAGDGMNVRSSLVKQMRAEAAAHQTETRPPLRYQQSHRAQDDENDDGDDEVESDEEEESRSTRLLHKMTNGKSSLGSKMSNITYEGEEDDYDATNLGGGIPRSGQNDSAAVGKKDPKKKKLKKTKKKKLSSGVTARGSDTDGSAAGGGHLSMKTDPKLFEQLTNQPRPSSKSAAAAGRMTDAVNNTNLGEKVINHRTVMLALKGGKKK